MQITCPSCAAQYAVPDGALAGRQVKCARCGEQWMPEPAPPPPTLTPVAAEMATPAKPFLPPPAPSPPPPRVVKNPALRPSLDRPAVTVPAIRTEGAPRPAVLAAAWAASVAVLLAVAVFAYAGRDGVMRAWPPSQRVYAALGLR